MGDTEYDDGETWQESAKRFRAALKKAEARIEELDERRETAVKLLTRISDSAWEVVERGTIEAFLMREMERAALDKKEV